MNKDKKSSTLKYGSMFFIAPGQFGKVTGLYALGFHYHTLGVCGNCIKGQQYMLHSEFNKTIGL